MTAKLKNGKISITEGSLFKNIILFAIPVIFTGLLQLLFTSVDNLIVGRICGSDALASIGTALPVVSLIVEVLLGLSTGASVCSAQAIGSKNSRDVHEVVHTAILMSIVGGVVLGCGGFFLAEQILEWMSVERGLLGDASSYLRIYFLGLPFMLFYNYGAGILRSAGDTKRPLYYLFAGGALNIILDFIFVNLWGISGAAIATVLSQVTSATLLALFFMRTNEDYKLSWKRLRIYTSKFKKILLIGIPAGLQGVVFCFSNVVVQSSINSLGPAVMAGHSAAGNFEAFAYNAMTGFNQAAVTFVSQNLGARKLDRMKKSVVLCATLVCITGLVLNGIVLLARYPLLELFIVDSPAAIAVGINRMLIICPFHCLCGVLQVYMAAIQSMGSTVAPVIISVAGSCGLRITWIFTVFKAIPTAEALFWCYPVSWASTLVAMFILYMIVRPIQFRRMGLINEK